MEAEAEKVAEGEKPGDLMKLYTPVYTLPNVIEDLFDPIPALLSKLLDDVNKLGSVVMQHVPPPVLNQLNLRNVLIDRTQLQGVAGASRPPQQMFFPVYQQQMPPPLVQGYLPPPPQPPRMPNPPNPGEPYFYYK